MYVRRKQNSSGSVSIQIVEKVCGKVRILSTVGVAHTKGEEQRLRCIGKSKISELSAQLQLSLETSENRVIKSFLSEGSPPIVTNVGPELILGSVFDAIGLNAIE